jgi:hypothetical protein
MAFIDKTDLKDILGIAESDTDSDDRLTLLAEALLSLWDDLTGKVWAENTYNSYYTAKSGNVFLDNYPVSEIQQVSSGKATVMQVYNSNTYSLASVRVAPTEILLRLNGVLVLTLTFDSYTTLDAVSEAINALGSGWVAEVIGDYGGWESTTLITTQYKSCMDSDRVDLNMPSVFHNDYEYDEDSGIIEGSFPKGKKNVYVKYTAGYADEDCPAWLKNILIKQAAYWFMDDKNRNWAVNSESAGMDGGSTTWLKNTMIGNLLSEFEIMASRHRKINV